MFFHRSLLTALSALGALFITTSTLPGFIQITNVGGQVIMDGSTGVDYDIDGDGNFDVNVAYFGTSVNSIFAWDGVVRAAAGSTTQIVGTADDGNGITVATLLTEGDSVGPTVDASFVASNLVPRLGYEEFFGDFNSGGDWLSFTEPVRGYVGFAFDISGSTHFGWIDLELDNIDDSSSGSVIVHRYAYSTASDSVAAIPEPSHLTLAFPALFSMLLRRRRS